MSQHPSPTQYSSYQSARKDGQAVRQEASTYMSDKDAERFCEVMAEALDSGLGYSRILDFLARRGLRSSIISRLSDALLQQGCNLPDALARFGILDPVARKLILVGEKQGTLPEAFSMQAPMYRRRYEGRQQTVSALIEPLFLFYIAIGFFRPILSNVMAIYKSTENTFIAALGFAAPHALMGLVPVAILLFFAWLWIKTPVDFPPRDLFSAIWMRIPVLSEASRLGSVARFSRFFYTSVRTGMTIYDSIRLAAEASNDPRMMSRISLVLENLDQGVSLQQSLGQLNVLPADALDYIGLGEETGRLEEMLAKAATNYEQKAKEMHEKMMNFFIYISRILCVFGPLFYIFLEQIGEFGKIIQSVFSAT